MTADDQEYIDWLRGPCGYLMVKELPGRRYAAVQRLMYHYSLIVGKIGDRAGFDDRWCYGSDLSEIVAALVQWDGSGEPAGWYRNPTTGRRRLADGTFEIRW